jgi:hypothetical protein
MDELVLCRHGPYTPKLFPETLDAYFGGQWHPERTLADVLLENDATAIYHIDPTRFWSFPEDYQGRPHLRPLLLGVNYHLGHSEGDYKVVVQNIPQRKGPWVLFRPPSSDEHSFYLQNLVYTGHAPEFSEDVANIPKINDFYLFRGDPLQIFADFQARGFTFRDEPMPTSRYSELMELAFQAKTSD